MPESNPKYWKSQIHWELFPQTESVFLEKRKTVAHCPRCQEVFLVPIDRENSGKCSACGLKYWVYCEGGQDMRSQEKEMSPKEVEELNRIKMIASFRQVIGHYVTEQAGLKRTLENINHEQKEVQERAQELLDGHIAITGHIRAGEGILERLQAAVDKLNAQIVEKA